MGSHLSFASLTAILILLTLPDASAGVPTVRHPWHAGTIGVTNATGNSSRCGNYTLVSMPMASPSNGLVTLAESVSMTKCSVYRAASATMVAGFLGPQLRTNSSGWYNVSYKWTGSFAVFQTGYARRVVSATLEGDLYDNTSQAWALRAHAVLGLFSAQITSNSSVSFNTSLLSSVYLHAGDRYLFFSAFLAEVAVHPYCRGTYCIAMTASVGLDMASFGFGAHLYTMRAF